MVVELLFGVHLQRCVDIVMRRCVAQQMFCGCVYMHSAENALLKNVTCINSNASGGSDVIRLKGVYLGVDRLIGATLLGCAGLILSKDSGHDDFKMLQMKKNTSWQHRSTMVPSLDKDPDQWL